MQLLTVSTSTTLPVLSLSDNSIPNKIFQDDWMFTQWEIRFADENNTTDFIFSTDTKILSNAIVIDDKEWRQPIETRGYSYNEVATICPTNGTQCSGMLDQVDFTDWIWAPITEVEDMFKTFNSTFNPPQQAVEIDSTWAPEVLDAFLPIMNLPDGSQQLTAYSSSFLGSNMTNVAAGVVTDSLPGSNDLMVSNVGNPVDVKNSGIGIWLYKNVPPPNAAPTADIGGPYTVECTRDVSTGLTIFPTVFDADGDQIDYSITDPFSTLSGTTTSGSTLGFGLRFPLGSSVISMTVSDQLNSATFTTDVEVVDTIAPIVNTPPDVTQEATSSGLQTVNLGAPSFDEDCSPGPSWSRNPQLFPLGETTVIYSATDASGNVSDPATQLVTITDTTPPTLTVPLNLAIDTTGALTPVDIGTATATDFFSSGNRCE